MGSAAGDERRTYLLVDGENIDATLGGNVLQRRPERDERPRWDRILTHLRDAWGQPATGLFFLNASSGHLPMPFVQALTALGYRVVPLAGPSDVKVVDAGILRTLAAIVRRDADVVLASHDADFAAAMRDLVATPGRRTALLGFREFVSTAYADLERDGLGFLDIEYDVGAFTLALPRLRILQLDEFDPEQFL